MSKRCRNTSCKKLFEPFNSMTIACSPSCALEVVKTKEGRKHRDKAFRKETGERRYKLDELKIRKKAAKLACHAYIRARDLGKPCPCCGEPLGDDYQAGHFIESGNYPFIRYHEDNIHGQRKHCNVYKGGDSGSYDLNLRIMIGDERVDWLKANKNNEVKRKPDDYKAIEVYYKEKLKALQ